MTTAVGIAQAWTASRADQRQQAMELLALRQQAASDQAVVAMLEEAAPPPSDPPPPPGQGQHVDRRV